MLLNLNVNFSTKKSWHILKNNSSQSFQSQVWRLKWMVKSKSEVKILSVVKSFINASVGKRFYAKYESKHWHIYGFRELNFRFIEINLKFNYLLLLSSNMVYHAIWLHQYNWPYWSPIFALSDSHSSISLYEFIIRRHKTVSKLLYSFYDRLYLSRYTIHWSNASFVYFTRLCFISDTVCMMKWIFVRLLWLHPFN